jgi:hypothetical protein
MSLQHAMRIPKLNNIEVPFCVYEALSSSLVTCVDRDTLILLHTPAYSHHEKLRTWGYFEFENGIVVYTTMFVHGSLKPVIVAIIENNSVNEEAQELSNWVPGHENFALKYEDVEGSEALTLLVTMPCWKCKNDVIIGPPEQLNLAGVKERFTDEYYNALRQIPEFSTDELSAGGQVLNKDDWLHKQLKKAVAEMTQTACRQAASEAVNTAFKTTAKEAVKKSGSTWFLSFDGNNTLRVLTPFPIGDQKEGESQQYQLELHTLPSLKKNITMEKYEAICNWKEGVIKGGKTPSEAIKGKLLEAVEYMPEDDQENATKIINAFKLDSKWANRAWAN